MKITITIDEVGPKRSNRHPHRFDAVEDCTLYNDELNGQTPDQVAETMAQTVRNFLRMWGYGDVP